MPLMILTNNHDGGDGCEKALGGSDEASSASDTIIESSQHTARESGDLLYFFRSENTVTVRRSLFVYAMAKGGSLFSPLALMMRWDDDDDDECGKTQ